MKRVVITISIAVAGLMAGNYSQMTFEELNALRGTIPVEERDAFRAEMQSRMQAMTPQERETFRAQRSQQKKV